MDPVIHHIIRARSVELFDKVKGYREHIHRFPELSYAEFNTMNFVAEQLEKIGIPFQKEVAGTGLLGIIRSDEHTETDSCIGLRSELDALPITEQTNRDYSSTIEGVMHACGHDVHTACLLGAARILQETKEEVEEYKKIDPITQVFGFKKIKNQV